MTTTNQSKRLVTFLAAALVGSTAAWGAVALAAENHSAVSASSENTVVSTMSSHRTVSLTAEQTTATKPAEKTFDLLGHPVHVDDIDVPEDGFMVLKSSYDNGDLWMKYVPAERPWRIVEAYYDKETLAGVRTYTQPEELMPHVKMADRWWEMEDPATTSLTVLARWNDGQTGDASDPVPPLRDLADDVVGSLMWTASASEERVALLTLLTRMPGAKASEATVQGRDGVELSWDHDEDQRKVIVVASGSGEVIASRNDTPGHTGAMRYHYQEGVAHVDVDVLAQLDKWRADGECYEEDGDESCGEYGIDQ